MTDFVTKQGFEVKKSYILPTGWEAKFTHGSGGRTIGVNSGDQYPFSNPFCGDLTPDVQRWMLFLALAMPVAIISLQLPESPLLVRLRSPS